MSTMAFGEFTIRIDCDVLQADGGTRTAGITGGCVALADACSWLAERTGQPSPFGQLVAAISVGVVDGEVRLDLAYAEDKDAGVDSNIVMVEPAEFVEVQGTGEHATFTRAQLEIMLDSAEHGIRELFGAQRRVLGW
jgi:ribonuclease PH